MTGDRWTFLLLRDGRIPIRQISISKRTVGLFVGGSTALVVSLVALAATLGIGGTAHLRASQLALENQTLSQELSSIQESVNGMEGRVGNLSTMDSRLRLLAGLDLIDPEVLQVGIGGPSTSSPQLNSLWPVDSTLSKAAFAVRYDLNALERKAGLLRESMDEATDSLMAHTDLLESTPSILPAAGIISSPFSKSRHHPIHHSPTRAWMSRLSWGLRSLQPRRAWSPGQGGPLGTVRWSSWTTASATRPGTDTPHAGWSAWDSR